MLKSYPILGAIEGPEDIKKLSKGQLEKLAEEVRGFILEKLSPVGGHLASSLGVVELTIALHAVFDSPSDKIIWDVGHQCYPHKILTGRRDEFASIRQKGGIAGFPKREESEHDAFDTGHSSTSISAGLGMAVARDMVEGENKVVAVIGDGSMTAGLAFEGLNHAGHLDTDLVVILNDNDMSISPNVGALSSYLSRVMTGEFYSKLRHEVDEFLHSIPSVGDRMAKLAKRVEEHAKGFISPGMLFEELGFTYVGPIDGHNINHLTVAFNNIKKFKKPTLVHVFTKKGKGFEPAEDKPSAFHGVGPFNPSNGIATGKGGGAPSYTKVFGDTLVELGKRDKRIVAITAAMPDGTGLDDFRREFPDRFFDVGIAEEHAVTFAAGLAAEGAKPVVAIYSTFLQRSFDQIIHDVALQKLPVVFCVDRAGLVGADGPTHHGVFDLSYLRQVPGLALIAPSDECELQRALKTGIEMDGPVAIRYPRGSGEGVDLYSDIDSIEPYELGKGRLMSKGDGEVLLLSAGTLLGAGLEGAELAAEEGVDVTVFDCRFVKPLDEEAILGHAREARTIVTLEENTCVGGFGAAILELLNDNSIHLPVKRISLPDEFVEHGSQAELRAETGLDPIAIRNTLLEAGRR